MDLNELPPDVDFDFIFGANIDTSTNNPTFCTQVDPEEQQCAPSVSEVDPVDQRDAPNVSEVRLSLEETHLEEIQQVVHNTELAGGQSGTEGLFSEAVEAEVWSTPQGPHNGMTFSTLLEAKEYYNSYAKRIGFSIRTNTSRRSAFTKEVEKVQFVCNKEGKGKKSKSEEQIDELIYDSDDDSNSDQEGGAEMPVEGEEDRKHNKNSAGIKRKREKMKCTQCKARMVVKLIGARWHLMSEFYGSRQLVPYEDKDVHNFRSTLRTTEKYKDMQETLEYFEELKQHDPEYFYKFKLDDDYRLRNLFWIDGAARRAYETYHDCVSFDTTYMTNMYDMPFAPFIGINRHGQSFQLGCAFLRDEKTPSFVWLFQTFLEAMKEKAPLNIITDQDGAMRSAIEHVFPLANHRNCRWHIMNKAAGTVGPLLKEDKELEDEFKDCINYSVMPEEFEAKWQAMIQKHQSTQRSEGFNAVLKLYVSPNLSILDFVKQYQKIQDKCLVAQDGQDFRTDDKTRNTWSKNPIEKHASTVYTKNIFYRFSKEFEKIEEYFVQHIGDYQFRLVPNDKFVDGYGTRSYNVTAVEEEESYYCECSKFDRDGIICCHIIKVMSRFGVKKLPDRYIMGRWKQQEMTVGTNANANLQADVGTSGMPLQNQKTIRFSNLASTLTKFAREGSNSEDAYEIVTRHIGMMRSELEDLKKKKKKRTRCNEISANTAAGALNNPSTPHATNAHMSAPSAPLTTATSVAASTTAMSSHTGLGTIGTNLQDPTIPSNSGKVKNPPRSVVKGRKKSKRLSNGMNAQPKRRNQCSICHSDKHTAPKCPNKIEKRVPNAEMQLFT
ncbi:protein FAR1-RELATED SEQUENCE 5-like [Phragmites australis]|uniref:protein FAR1-RELATED SEQUENCE 5-like n=1 Tax=Phragmites australis TaxID=29695 RepID=UPI002D76AC72|nr:protein FAR1-RELATED SEQUENCE 5-like [Phragmites australis]